MIVVTAPCSVSAAGAPGWLLSVTGNPPGLFLLGLRIGVMTAAHAFQLMSLDQWRALPQEFEQRSELQEGVRIVSPRPTPAHSRMVSRLWQQIDAQLPDGFEVLQEVEVVIDARTPATVRVPDLIVRTTTADDALITADQVLLAVEVVSPGSRRTDHVTKRSEYAEAGIGCYWIIDLDSPATLTALTLTEHGYEGSQAAGSYTTIVPVPLEVAISSS